MEFGELLEIKKVATVCSNLFDSDRLSYEQLHLKTCKNAIQIGKNTSNIGVKSELGCLPLIYNIISAICKYRMRLEYHTDGDILFHAFKSQLKLNSNSYNTLTYSKFTKEVFQELGFPTIPMIKSKNTMKRTLNSLVKPVMDNCRKYYINWFKDKLASLKNSEESKLQMSTLLKGQYQYECFLDHRVYTIWYRSRSI